MLKEDKLETLDFILQPSDNHRLANLCGHLDDHLRMIEQRIGVDINNRGASFQIKGAAEAVHQSEVIINTLYRSTIDQTLTPEIVHLTIVELSDNNEPKDAVVRTKRSYIKARGGHQAEYVEGIRKCDLSFGVGPAGTGKTYLAVACAVEALEKDAVRRIVLVRPAVEAGEKLGFLPGDLAQKVDPYLRPMYDALYEMLGFDKVGKLIEKNVIEVAPLAYMRGRTLNEAFIVMDEAQNTTTEQMKMFLTRIGFGSTAIVTGDMTQIDLPNKQHSGLRHALEILKDIDGVHVTQFNSRDVVRHPLVKRIVDAYEQHDKSSQ